MPFLLCPKEDDLVDLLLRFIKQGAGKEPCQRDSKATEVRAVQHAQLRYCEREYLSIKQKSILHSDNGGYRFFDIVV